MGDLVEMQARQLEYSDSAQAILTRAEDEERDLTSEEETQVEDILAKAETLKKRIDQHNRLASFQAGLAQSVGRQGADRGETGGATNAAAVIRGNNVRSGVSRNDGKWGFASLGEHVRAVIISRNGTAGHLDPRLIANQPSTWGSEAVGADGGFLVPPDFRTAILQKVQGEESLLSRTDSWTTGSNTLVLPVDETTPWQTTGGVQVYWEAEAAQFTASKISLQQREFRLNKLTALIPVTEELTEDANALDAYLLKKIPEKMDFAVSAAIVSGSGVGSPLGILNSGALVSVAQVDSQDADTLLYQNVVEIYKRMYGPCRSNAVWLINQDVEAQLYTMAFPQPSGSTSSYPAYMPAGGLSGAPYGTLFGRPVIPTQACSTLGDKGDIIFADLSKYLTVLKTGVANPKTDVSIHVYFEYNINALRVVFRLTGAPWWAAPISPLNGNTTYSAFVTLDERAGNGG